MIAMAHGPPDAPMWQGSRCLSLLFLIYVSRTHGREERCGWVLPCFVLLSGRRALSRLGYGQPSWCWYSQSVIMQFCYDLYPYIFMSVYDRSLGEKCMKVQMTVFPFFHYLATNIAMVVLFPLYHIYIYYDLALSILRFHPSGCEARTKEHE